MTRLAVIVAGLGLVISGVGCQCCGVHEPYEGFIDFVSDRAVHFDWLYKPGLDATRIGHSDWCRSPLNRRWCHRSCSGGCQNGCQDGYQALSEKCATGCLSANDVQ